MRCFNTMSSRVCFWTESRIYFRIFQFKLYTASFYLVDVLSCIISSRFVLYIFWSVELKLAWWLIIKGSLIWSRDIICLHILLHRKFFLCSKICKHIMSLDQMRDTIINFLKSDKGHAILIPGLVLVKKKQSPMLRLSIFVSALIAPLKYLFYMLWCKLKIVIGGKRKKNNYQCWSFQYCILI